MNDRLLVLAQFNVFGTIGDDVLFAPFSSRCNRDIPRLAFEIDMPLMHLLQALRNPVTRFGSFEIESGD